MDEPSSNIDLNTDKITQKVIKKAFKDKTMIVITHRLASIEDCDRVFEMKEGRLFPK